MRKTAFTRHGPPALDFQIPQGLEAGHLPPAGDQRQGAGELAGVDVPLNMFADPRQARRGSTDLFGFHEHATAPWWRTRLSVSPPPTLRPLPRRVNRREDGVVTF